MEGKAESRDGGRRKIEMGRCERQVWEREIPANTRTDMWIQPACSTLTFQLCNQETDVRGGVALDEAMEKKWVRGAMGNKKHAYHPLGPKVFRWNKQFRQLQRQQYSQRQSEKQRRLLANYWARELAEGSKERKRGQMSTGCGHDPDEGTCMSMWKRLGSEDFH